jgi:RNA-directed DNA polymerase
VAASFDTVSQDWLVRFVEHRIGDKRILRLIQKWLKAGVLEDGGVTTSDRGTGQGSVISPLLANVYLHYVFDLWADRWRKREATGDMIIVRYADDIIVGFQHEGDARRFWDAMRERLGEFALRLHPDKTRLIEFGRFAAANRERRGLSKPETFDFLGFTFICGKSRKGGFLLKRKTRADRMRAKLEQVKEGLRQRMHRTIAEQGRWLGQVVTGYFNYFAVPTNDRAPRAFRYLGDARSGGAVRRTTRHGTGQTNWRANSSPSPESFTPGPASVSPSDTRGGSRMRESRTYGSVRGARRDARPYRDRCARNDGREIGAVILAGVLGWP